MTTPRRFVSGAVDLGEVKARAEAKKTAATAPAAGGVAPVVTLTRDNVEQELLQRSTQVPVITLIGSPRSQDSEQLRVDFSTIAQGAQLTFVFAYVNADETPDVAQMFGIQGLPTVVALAAGQPVASFEGGQPLQELQKWVSAVVAAVGDKLTGLPGVADQPEPSDPRLERATEALNRGDFGAAIGVYEEILAQEPKNAEILAARDNARLLQRLHDADPQVDAIAQAAAAPTDVDAAFAAADAEIASGLPEHAFDRLIQLLSTVPEHKTRIRERLVELFALFDSTDPRVLAARRKMASALF